MKLLFSTLLAERVFTTFVAENANAVVCARGVYGGAVSGVTAPLASIAVTITEASWCIGGFTDAFLQNRRAGAKTARDHAPSLRHMVRSLLSHVAHHRRPM
jgi:hypothetical protein